MLDDEESVFDRLGEKIVGDRFAFLVPLWVARRPESLTILDYRPTTLIFFTAVVFVVATVLFFLFLFWFKSTDSYGLWITGILAVAALLITFTGTVREAYYFDKTKDSYAFVRQFIYRRELVEGSLGQFTSAYVKTESYAENSKAYFVVLQQEGMFLTGVSEQILRQKPPIFNSYERESRIANAISGFLAGK